MGTQVKYQFVAVHLKSEKLVYGYLYDDKSWSVVIRWMTNNKSEDGRTIQINHACIEMIESMDIEEAPWNEPKEGGGE